MRLMEYLPEKYRNSPETVAIQEAIQPEADAFWAARDELLRQLNPRTASGRGLKFWEDAMGVRPAAGDGLDQRRGRVIAKIRGMGVVDAPLLKAVVESFLVRDVNISEYPRENRVEVRFSAENEAIAPDGAELIQTLLEIVPAHLDLLTFRDIWGDPFLEMPGHLVFRRFAMAWTFQSPHDRMALGISRLQIAPYRFHHISGAVRFDGGSNFDGSIIFDQAYGALGFPSFRVNSKFCKPKERLHTPSFRGAGTARVTNRGGDLDLLRFTYTASLKHSENLSGKINMDNWHTFDGTINFDGTKNFDASIIEEEL